MQASNLRLTHSNSPSGSASPGFVERRKRLRKTLSDYGISGEELQTLRSTMRKSPYRELRSVRVQAKNHTVWLYGQVSCYYLKQQAQAAIRRISPDLKIQNRICVSWK